MIKILIGGSPCTYWSIAQKNNREVEAEGLGWELFKNYLIAKEKFKPDFFLYENNKSAAQPIKDQISQELGVPLQYINSSLVSAQNRQRLYWSNIPGITQPEDRGILLRDILETGICWREKSYTLDAHYYKSAGEYNPTKQHSYSRHMAAEPVGITADGKAHALTTKCQFAIPEDSISKKRHSMAAEPINFTEDEKAYALKAQYYKSATANFMNGGGHYPQTGVAEPVRIGTIENDAKNNDFDSQQYRVYSPDGKSVLFVATVAVWALKLDYMQFHMNILREMDVSL
jgi:DNA (cytosine-5)-methyltransferase 3A